MLEFLEAAATCDIGEGKDAVLGIMYYAKLILKILQIAVPVGLIIFGTIDMAKAVIAGDEKKMKEAQKPFVKRIISAVIVFLIPFIVNLVMNLVTTGNDTWKKCWNEAKSSEFKSFNANSDLK